MTQESQQDPANEYLSLLNYYQAHQFNPVLIPLGTTQQWHSHTMKRHNLYERHLSIPLSFLRGRSVIEFGCNSGENALVLAASGANLTLVEPNDQVLPRLQELFSQFGLSHQIARLTNETIESFQTDQQFDLVIAEGFLYTLPNREALLTKMATLVRPGGLLVVSFNDRYGCLMEITKQVILRRICQLLNIDDFHSERCLEIARQLFQDDFAQLHSSRSFDMWWQDTLINPFVASEYLWSYLELLPILEQAGCEFYSSSPVWATADRFQWYKTVVDTQERQENLLTEWLRVLPFFLTGLPITTSIGASVETIDSVATWIRHLTFYVHHPYEVPGSDIGNLFIVPALLESFLLQSTDQNLRSFGTELRKVYEALMGENAQEIIRTYQSTELRGLWGSAYHYICTMKTQAR
jgi:SAM-dependent methyltransferase